LIPHLPLKHAAVSSLPFYASAQIVGSRPKIVFSALRQRLFQDQAVLGFRGPAMTSGSNPQRLHCFVRHFPDSQLRHTIMVVTEGKACTTLYHPDLNACG